MLGENEVLWDLIQEEACLRLLIKMSDMGFDSYEVYMSQE